MGTVAHPQTCSLPGTAQSEVAAGELAEAPKASASGSRALSAPGPTVLPAPPLTRGSLLRFVNVKLSGSFVVSSGHLLSALSVHTERSPFLSLHSYYFLFLLSSQENKTYETKPTNKARAPKGKNKLPPPVFWSFLAFHPSSPQPSKHSKISRSSGPESPYSQYKWKMPNNQDKHHPGKGAKQRT